MHYFVKALNMNRGGKKDDYSPVRSSDEDSKDGLLQQKERLDAYEKPPTFWSRNGRFILVQIALLAVYSAGAYLLSTKIASLRFRGQPLSHCE